MSISSLLIAGPSFTGPWPAWVWVAVIITTVVVVAIAVVLNRL